MNISLTQSSYFANYGISAARKAAASFSETVQTIQAAPEAAAVVPQSIDEYKQAFMAKIEAIAIHPSQTGARQSISIAEGLWTKMQADPELEQQVLSQIESDLSANFVVSPAFTTMRFDENGVYSGTAGGSAHMASYERESSDAFWRREPTSVREEKNDAQTRREERKERRKKMDELLDELAAQRRLTLRAAQDGRREVSLGIADYVRGPQSIVRPSVIESLL